LKKTITISLLFVFLLANTELHQILKLSVLIHHFLSHHQDEQNKSFFYFLNDHYNDTPEHSDNGDKEHDNLPFKTADCATAHISLAFVNHIQFSIPRPTVFHVKISPIYNGAFYSSAVVSNIWQPPKIS
jgi:hypothetical protein